MPDKNITHQFFYPCPPQTVWEYLTTPELMTQWLMPNDFQPVVGHEFQFRTSPIPKFDFDGIFYCKVLELIPPKKLVYSWKSGPGEGRITIDSIVTWTLEEQDGGTALLLVHSGFGEMTGSPIYQGMDGGWLQNIQKIDNLIKAAKHGATQD